jgi:UDP-N-acetylmuramate dehydrogenase
MNNIPGLIQKTVSLRPYTSWLVGGLAEFFVTPTNIEELTEAYAWALANKMPVTIISGGSNVLIADSGIPGLSICLKKFTGVSKIIEESEGISRLKIEALSGTAKAELLRIFIQQGLAPALFLAGIPGDVGGGVVMNAGVAETLSPREFCEIIDWIEVLTPQLSVQRLQSKDLHWSYRHCSGWQPGIIVKVGISCANIFDEQILPRVREANRVRLSKQPLDLPSCGSVFKNPEGHKAAQLIDSCGLKGSRIGDAEVSMKHANFIVNHGKATALDIWNLILRVQQEVFKIKKVHLTTEVVRLGDWSGTLLGVL